MPADVKDKQMRKVFEMELEFWGIKPMVKKDEDLCKVKFNPNISKTFAEDVQDKDSWVE